MVWQGAQAVQDCWLWMRVGSLTKTDQDITLLLERLGLQTPYTSSTELSASHLDTDKARQMIRAELWFRCFPTAFVLGIAICVLGLGATIGNLATTLF